MKRKIKNNPPVRKSDESVRKVFQHRFPFWRNVYQLWQSVLELTEFPQFDRWLAAEMRKHRNFGKRERYWYSEMLFSAMRFGYLVTFLHFTAGKFKPGSEKPDWDFASFIPEFNRTYPDFPAVKAQWQTLPAADFFYWIFRRYTRENPGFAITGEMPQKEVAPTLAAIFDRTEQQLPASNHLSLRLIWYGIPLWFEAFLRERAQRSGWEEDLLSRFISNHSRRPPLWLRLNHPQQKNNVIRELKEHGFEVQEMEMALQIRGTKGIFELHAYKNGWIEVQDLASQRIGERVNMHPGEMVWDCCAGGGGKTLQLAAVSRQKGAIYASDIREYKLEDLKKRVRRAQFHNIRTLVWEGDAMPEFGREVQKRGGFHRVLVDAPCSASGTWRRNPDARWRSRLSELAGLLQLQTKILQNASEAVLPGGSLIYATCSWLVPENEGVVENFLRNHSGFTLMSQEMLGNPYEDADTMFVAVMRREF